MPAHNETKIIPSGTTESIAMAAEGWKRELARWHQSKIWAPELGQQ